MCLCGKRTYYLVFLHLCDLFMALVYSCCFWFSLRLGGILVGMFSIVQAVSALMILCIIHKEPDIIKDEISMWMKNLNLIYINNFLESFLKDTETYITLLIFTCCVYTLTCLLFVYGAYTCNNVLMVLFILLELIRLITILIIVITWLLVLKQNTMDIGLVIGASVASGFVLLGMFYLWVCAANLPVLIIEMEREEQEATINKLQQLLQNNTNSKQLNPNVDGNNFNRKDLFVIPTKNIPYNPYYFVQ